MGYYSSLINRKFKDVVGNRYEGIIKEYKEFLLTEEEVVKDVKTILLPLDIFVKEIPNTLYELLSIYGAEVTLVYIVDRDAIAMVKEILGEDSAKEYAEKKEKHGYKLIEKISAELEDRGISSKERLFAGHKLDNIETMSNDFDLVAISKSYGGGRGDENEISPVSQRLISQINAAAVLY
ncbi:hypothetical protein L1994_02605 [Methanomicrobium antiquum]|uniref:Uncharacterized protein n=1 Tax=Methanomicrobium antiquum TaxID=487686 RepID=A0AAF0FPM1_9EURY|nr:hypothetical protein [Methanomicrobium antiquum]WFN37297.1 hypothetical protein L1994_02605 [Methanomicrobium antiquum]